MPTDDPTASSSPPGDEPIETTFRRLRREGHSRREAVRALLDELDLSLREVKEVLLTSDTWAEARDEADAGSEPPSSDGPPPAPG
jgi:hypothetical protein